jgi:hypothetical protein
MGGLSLFLKADRPRRAPFSHLPWQKIGLVQTVERFPPVCTNLNVFARLNKDDNKRIGYSLPKEGEKK